MIADTLNVSFEFNVWLAYSLAIFPGAFYVWVCYKCKTDTQINVGVILSSILGILMIGIIVGTLARLLNQSPLNPSAILLYCLIVIFLIAGMLHPREFKCLVPGILYFISLPAAFILLNIYSFVNLNNVSWGTREIANTKTASTTTTTTSNHLLKSKSEKSSFLARIFARNKVEPNDVLASILVKLDKIEKQLSFSSKSSTKSMASEEDDEESKNVSKTKSKFI